MTGQPMTAAGQGSNRSRRLMAYEGRAFIALSNCGQRITVMALRRGVNTQGECWSDLELSAHSVKKMEQGLIRTPARLIWLTRERTREHLRVQHSVPIKSFQDSGFSGVRAYRKPGYAPVQLPLWLSTANPSSCPSRIRLAAWFNRSLLPVLHFPSRSSHLWFFGLLLILKMPRLRGTPRRGSNTESRGGSCSRGGSVPHTIAPLSTVPPPSPPSENSGPSIAPVAPSSPASNSSDISLNSSFHSARFQFRSRLNKPLISALVTVIFEEEEEQISSDNPSSEPSNVQMTSNSPGSPSGAVLNVPDQKEMEIPEQKELENPPLPAQEPVINREPERFRNILHLVLPPGRSATDVEDNVMVEWVNLTPDEEFGLPPKD